MIYYTHHTKMASPHYVRVYDSKISLGFEGLATNITGKWPLPTVCPPVSLHMSQQPE
jgi:hypothetical protein